MFTKKTVIEDIDYLLTTFCKECYVKKTLRDSYGKENAHQFCIEHCSVGEKLKFLGQEMNKI